MREEHSGYGITFTNSVNTGLTLVCHLLRSSPCSGRSRGGWSDLGHPDVDGLLHHRGSRDEDGGRVLVVLCSSHDLTSVVSQDSVVGVDGKPLMFTTE